MDSKELRELTTQKLNDRLAEIRGKVLKLRFGVANRQVKNVRELRSFKSEIARMVTVLNERRLNKGETPKQGIK